MDKNTTDRGESLSALSAKSVADWHKMMMRWAPASGNLRADFERHLEELIAASRGAGQVMARCPECGDDRGRIARGLCRHPSHEEAHVLVSAASLASLEHQIDTRDRALERASVVSAADAFLVAHDAYSHFECDATGVRWQTGGKAWGVAGGPWMYSSGCMPTFQGAIVAAAMSLGFTAENGGAQ